MQQFDFENRFAIGGYDRRAPFCSFLPGIAGKKGIPLWCFYVNRGQGICSFGTEDKDHAIMEFYPAHQAYRNTALTGFRTFVRTADGNFELFSSPSADRTMYTGMNDLVLRETDPVSGLETEVTYFALPGERLASLVRKVTVTNRTDHPLELTVLDGMPEVIPYGINMHSMKQMTQTAKAWMQVVDADQPVAGFRVRTSMEDSSEMSEVRGVHFASACDSTGTALPLITDPDQIFGADTSLRIPEKFFDTGRPFPEGEGRRSNFIPACFSLSFFILEPGQTETLWLMTGCAESKELADTLCGRIMDPEILEAKHREAIALTKEVTDAIATETADPVFDAYCRQTRLDNLLRGGMPVSLPGGKMTYMYSRKHGDPERDYNAFRVRAEYYSQGNGNFRDVNQNRRSDVLFDPATGDRNIRMFFDLLQADGYNPLVVDAISFTLPETERSALLGRLPDNCRNAAEKLLSRPFTPGELAMAAEDWLGKEEADPFFAAVLEVSSSGLSASFGEGYWSDHWTYNLDQIESYLSVWPEHEKELFFGAEDYTWYTSGVSVLPREKRYRETSRGIRQYAFLENFPVSSPFLQSAGGQVMKATLAEKLFSLVCVKTATLDPGGMGIEMEGGKPGWYDALNGLPGLLGSSVAETLELRRVLTFMTGLLSRYPEPVSVMEEVGRLADRLTGILENSSDPLTRWKEAGTALDAYRAALKRGVTGRKVTYSSDEVSRMLGRWLAAVSGGIRKAMSVSVSGLCPTYFAWTVTAYDKTEDGIFPAAFERVPMPDFLEGQVRYLRLDLPEEEKEALIRTVRNSALFDRKLKMFKVNADLASAGYEIGRAFAFTPGWLENESVWLHMEYKYLLELLRCGAWKEFSDSAATQLIPFLAPETYGRSTLENSSFIASSANPDPGTHGRGFVARLSGSTAEFLSMWQLMMIGDRPMRMEDDELTFRLNPVLPRLLTKGTGTVRAALFGTTAVCYRIRPDLDYFPGSYTEGPYEIRWKNGTVQSFDRVTGETAARVRAGEAAEITVELKRDQGSVFRDQ